MVITQAQARKNINNQFLVNFFSGFTFLVPIITLFYTFWDLSIFEIVIIANVATLVVWLFEIPTSVLADTYGRKKSLLISTFCNVIGAVIILVFPSFIGFCLASFFAGLYFSFWSGTGQAFLDENLEVLDMHDKFGKYIGKFMFAEQMAALITPLFVAIILKYFFYDGFAYSLLAAMDVVFALIMFVLMFRLKETIEVSERIKGFKESVKLNVETLKVAFNNIIKDASLRSLLIYRSFANHIAFFPLILLPILVAEGMPEWFSGVIMTIAALVLMLSMKFAYTLGEKFGYLNSWVVSTVIQAVFLIVAGLVIHSWIAVAVIFILFNIVEGVWQPSWNHVVVAKSRGKSVATTRSIIFSAFALYTTIGKQILAFIDVNIALIGLGVFIIIFNLIYSRKVMRLNKES